MQVCPKIVRKTPKLHPLVHHNVSWCHGLSEIFQCHPKQIDMQNLTYNSDKHSFLFFEYILFLSLPAGAGGRWPVAGCRKTKHVYFGLLWWNVFRLEGDVQFKVPHDSSAPACIPVNATSTVASSGRFLRFARYHIYIYIYIYIPSGKLI